MGTVAMAVDDPANLSLLNPALLANVGRFTMHAEGVPEFRRIEDRKSNISNTRSTNFPLLRLALAVPRVGVLGVGLGQYTDVSYELGETVSLAGHTFEQTLEGANGWSSVALSWARQLRPELKVGVDLNLLIGSYVDIWTVTPDTTGLNTTVDSLVVNHSRGPLLRLGAIYAPTERWRLGASLVPGRTIELRTERRSETGSQRMTTQDLDLPLSVGFGSSYLIDDHWLVAGDLQWTGWEQTNLQLARDNVVTRDVTRMAFGVEYKADRSGESRELRQQVAWRAGYYREPWHYLDPFGESLVDQFFSVGVGIPFPHQAGFFDLSVELGSRGDRERNHARERVMRIGVGVTLREVIAVGGSQ